MNHEQLIDALVQNRLEMNFIVFAEVGIGSRWLQQNNLPVPDVMSLRYSYTKPDVTIYEVKVSRRDFLQDVDKAKYKRYLSFCDRFYFACPIGILKKAEIPDDAGLIVHNSQKGWSVVKASPRHTADLNRIDWQSLMMAKYATLRRVRSLKERIIWEENISLADQVKSLGYKVRDKILEVEIVEKRIKEIKEVIAKGLGINPLELHKRKSWELESFLKKVVKGLVIPKEKELISEIISKLSETFCGEELYSWDRKKLLTNFRDLMRIARGREQNDLPRF